MKQLRHWQVPLKALSGVGVALSPWVLAFNTLERVTPGTAFAGLVIVALALWTVLTGKDF